MDNASVIFKSAAKFQEIIAQPINILKFGLVKLQVYYNAFLFSLVQNLTNNCLRLIIY